MTSPSGKPLVMCVVGARPNFMKIAPVMAALAERGDALAACLVHTGQHYDPEMNHRFFEDLGIPQPDVNLEVGSGSQAVQTAEIMRRFEPVVDHWKPACVLVVGDVNSTVACSLVAAKKCIPVVHVEAGLRSHDRTMPEEINRLVTDQLSDLLFTTERSARDNLLREGIADERIHFVGNVMIDTLHRNLGRAVDRRVTLAGASEALDHPEGYALVTLHRPSNVDEAPVLRRLLETLGRIARRLPVVLPLHPRTRGRVEQFGLSELLHAPGIAVLPPVGYLEILGLMRDARIVLTDSGGIQEETTALGVPCITLRENTERPITLDEGTNTLAGNDPARIMAALESTLAGGGKAGRVPEYWDGQAARRIVATLADWLAGARQRAVA